MSVINFPENLNAGDVLASGSTVRQFVNSVWNIVLYRPADFGNIDAGDEPGGDISIILNAGVVKSDFSASKSINGGTV
jgi:hypothetical protein